LDQLSKDEWNTVFVVSPHEKRLLHKWFGEHSPALGLAAEDGYLYRFNSHGKNEFEWHKLLEIDLDFEKGKSRINRSEF